MRITAIAVATLLAGCATQPTVVRYNITAPYNHQQAAEMMAPGDGQFTGTAFLRQRGGGVVTCAGRDVVMVPNTEYARQRVRAIYGHEPTVNETVGYDVNKAMANKIVFDPDVPEYKTDARTVKCDGQGEFVFDSMKDGEYFITTNILWEVGSTYQGGALATLVKISQGKAPKTIMSK